jgi:hypothetical protein
MLLLRFTTPYTVIMTLMCVLSPPPQSTPVVKWRVVQELEGKENMEGRRNETTSSPHSMALHLALSIALPDLECKLAGNSASTDARCYKHSAT